MVANTTRYKPKAHGVLDIETLSTDKRAAIVHMAIVIAYGGGGHNQWEAFIKPSEFAGSQFEIDQDTWNWHEKEHPGYLTMCEERGVTLAEALQGLVAFMADYATEFELHMWSQGKDFDFPIVDWALKNVGLKAPWAYSRVHCLRDLVWLNPTSRVSGSQQDKHNALSDAQWEAGQLRAVIANSNWYQRLFS
jgi:hypothetical protein